MAYNTFNTYGGDGSTTEFAIPFPYLRQEDVIVSRKNGPVSFVFLNPSLIQINSPLDVGDQLYVERKTAINTPSVVYSNGSSMTASNLNGSINQLLYSIQETYDRTGTVFGRSYQVSSFDSLFDGTTTVFRLDSGGANLGDIINDSGFWIVSLNGILLEATTDFTVAVDSNGTAQLAFIEAPQAGDNASVVFIHLYDGNLTNDSAGGGGLSGTFELDDLSDVNINNPASGQVLAYNGTRWVNTVGVGGGGGGTVTNETGIGIVDSLPAQGAYDGQTVYNTVDGKLYVWDEAGQQWLDIFQSFTPDAPDAVGIVNGLPPTGVEGQVVYNTADEKLYKYTAGNWVAVVLTNDTSAVVADGSITTAKFAAGIAPVEIVASLPGTGNFDGRMAYLTTDSKLYRYNGSQWTAAVDGADLTGSVDGSLLTANSIAAGVIQAGAVSASEIAAGAINTDKLAAGAITTEKLASLSVTALKIASDAITTDKLAANAITAGKIAAGAIGASQIAAGVITTDKIASNNFVLGAGNIADANITTLKIAGEAVIIPRAFYNQGGYAGINVSIPIATINFTLPYAAAVTFFFTANQAYSGTFPDTATNMVVNGSVISGVSVGGNHPNAVIALGGYKSLAAGSHSVVVNWFGASTDVTIGNISLVVTGAMR